MAPKREVNILIKATDEASKVFQNVSQRTLPDLAKSVARFATGFVSVAAIEETIRRSIDAALESEKATSRLNAALMAQGAAFQLNLPHLERHAEALARVSLADDETIKGAQATLAALGGLWGDTLDKATKATLDLAAGLGIEIPEAAEKLAKAANGSTREFSRLGVEFQKGASDADNFEKVLGFVQDRFGGMAEAQIHTTAGSFHELNEAVGELLETIGKKGITGSGGVFETFTRALQDLNDAANNPKSMGFWKSLGLLVGGAMTAGPGGLNSAVTALSASMAVAADEAERMQSGVNATVPDIRKLEKSTENIANNLKKAASSAPQLPPPSANRPFDSALPGSDLEALNDQILKQGLENWIRQLDTVPDALSNISAGFMQIGDEIDTAKDKTITWSEFIQGEFASAVAGAGAEFGGVMVDAAFGADVAWGEAIRNILAGLAKAIIQALIFRAIMTAISGGAGAALSGGGVAGAHAGGVFVPRGTDTIPAMLTPGEAVIPRGATRSLLNGRAAIVPTRGGFGRPVTINIQAMDGESVYRVLTRNSRDVLRALDYLDDRSA